MDIVLVPGLWLNAQTWDAVVPHLEAAGHRAHPLTLPGMVSKDADRTGVTLADHVAAVVAAVDACNGPVLLVAHSAGCGIAHAAVDARPDRVLRQVHVGPSSPGRNRWHGRSSTRQGEPMPPTLAIQCFNLDTTDPDRTASFWQEALGWRRTYDTPDEVVLEPPAGSPEDGVVADLLFARAPEGKTIKNRWHPDLRPTDQAAEVARLEDLGASRVDVGQSGEESWVVLADPDGNEFCVLRAFTAEELAEIAAETAG